MVTSATSATYGAMASMMTLVRALERRGHTVEFATWEGRGFTDEAIATGRPVHPIRVRAKIDPFAIARLAKVIRAGKFDIVHTHLSTSSIIGCLAARRAKVASVATVHGLSGKLSFIFAKHLITVSGATKEHMAAQGIPAERLSVVYNGIAVPELTGSKDEAQDLLGASGCYPVLATTARVLRIKGTHVGIEAIAKLKAIFPNIRYFVVGSGADMDEMKVLAATLGVEENVVFVGFVKDIWPVLRACDAFVFPSLKEAMGISIVEAMGLGLPVVASNVGGIPEVVNESCGRLVPAEDAGALAAGIREVLEHPELGTAARVRMVEKFSDDAMAAATVAVYRTLINK